MYPKINVYDRILLYFVWYDKDEIGGAYSIYIYQFSLNSLISISGNQPGIFFNTKNNTPFPIHWHILIYFNMDPNVACNSVSVKQVSTSHHWTQALFIN